MYQRVLSIQSHVVHGSAGNKSAVFPLQSLNFIVDPINTVQYSNHTAYPVVKGSSMTSNELKELYTALAENHVDNYSYILTGFCYSADLTREIVHIVKDQKKKNPNLLYFCDPVLGDNGKFYVPEEMVQAYKEALEVADIVTPNQFELQHLTGLPVTDETSALAAIDALMRSHPQLRFVCLTSGDFAESPPDSIVGLAVARCPVDSENAAAVQRPPRRLRFRVPRLAESFVGTGDLFTALLLAWWHRHPDDPKLALEKVASTVHAVLLNTLTCAKMRRHHGQPAAAAAALTQQELWASRELRLVQSRQVIENPPPSNYVQLID